MADVPAEELRPVGAVQAELTVAFGGDDGVALSLGFSDPISGETLDPV